MLLATAFVILPAAVVWGAIYFAFNEPAAATIPWVYGALSGASIVMFWLTKRLEVFRSAQLFFILLAPFALMWALGGFVNGSAVILWSLLAPLGALLFASRRHAVAWLVGFFVLLTISAFMEPLTIDDNNLPRWVIIVFFALNVAAVSAIVFGLFRYFLNLLELEQGKSQRLLLNVLPAEIAGILREGGRTIAKHHEESSVLFADVVGSTELAVRLSPEDLVELLNEVFSHFDTLVERYELEKIRTMGDNYMVASGVPRPRPDHAHALARMALDMNSYVLSNQDTDSTPLQFRIGINSGPLVAGVIGYKKFHYDIWGDTVNTASRMESNGTPGKIQITQATYALIKDQFTCSHRGTIDVKGKGVNGGEIMYRQGGTRAEMWRLKSVPPVAFNQERPNLTEGGLDVQGGYLPPCSQGLFRRRDERPRGGPSVRATPGHGAQDARVLRAPRVSTATTGSQTEARSI